MKMQRKGCQMTRSSKAALAGAASPDLHRLCRQQPTSPVEAGDVNEAV